jgi:hypothetical protein
MGSAYALVESLAGQDYWDARLRPRRPRLGLLLARSKSAIRQNRDPCRHARRYHGRPKVQIVSIAIRHTLIAQGDV